MKYLMPIGLLAAMSAFVIVNAPSAEARRYCPLGGYCPPGTCVKFNPHKRVQYACVAAICSAANCSR